MTDLDITPADLATFLGSDVDEYRAAMILSLAEQACASVTTLTESAVFVVLSVAARVYSSPVPVGSQTVGPYTVGGTVGGIGLTRAEERSLRRLSGGGGAFSVDVLPEGAGGCLPGWDAT